jgi:hypothetical protein
MATITVTRDRLHTDLKPGDKLVAIDGHTLPVAREVKDPKHLVNGQSAVSLVNALGTGTEWNIYPGNVIEVTIERPEPKPKRPVSQTRYGLRLTHGVGWESEDGVFRVGPGEAWTECDHAHPMRWKDERNVWHHGYCPGNQWHPYTVGWVIDGPGGYGLDDVYPTLDEAWRALAEALKKRRG